MTTAAAIWLASILGLSAVLKAWRHERAASALTTYGIASSGVRRVALWALVLIELTLTGALALQESWAAGAVCCLFLLFTGATSLALIAGHGGRPCACFGSHSRLDRSSPVRTLALAALAGVLAAGWLPSAPSRYERWLTVGLSVSLAAALALGVAVLALAREVGVLRLGMAGRGALEIPQEGPPVGSAQGWAQAIPAEPRALLRLAVFTSEGCPLCHQLAPALDYVAADPLLAVRSFDEAADLDVWRQAGVPGSPYAVALSLDGTVLSKGTFNSLGQLESILGTARAREQELPVAA
ncbi:MAG TPA: MauE/DoxX family redox-associated membrane protein [Solirubrobacteraceae bacterium]|jgi:hypothetical protein|nr:MauE/DoxX family redox-associated membrane protein [Solirubrobacteraceae bacterium]